MILPRHGKSFRPIHPLLFESEDAQNQPDKSIKHFKRPRKLLRVAAIAAVMLFALVISASALGFKPITKIVEWSKETFVFAITVIVILIADIFAFIVLLDRIVTYMGGTTLLNMLRF